MVFRRFDASDSFEELIADVFRQELLQVERIVLKLEIAHHAEKIAEARFLVVPFGRHAQRRVARDRNTPSDRGALAEFAAQVYQEFVCQTSRPQPIYERARAADIPAHEQVDSRVLRLQFFEALDHTVVKLFRSRGGRNFERLVDPANRIGGHKSRLRSLTFIHSNDGAPVGTRFVWPAALRRAAIVRDARLLIDGLLLVPAAKCHVMNAVALVAGRIARAVCDADREQAMCIAMKAAGLDVAVLAATGALHAGDCLTGAHQIERSTRATGNT